MGLLLHLHQGDGITVGSILFEHIGPEDSEHEVCRYGISYRGAGSLLKAEVEHRHADGPWVLVREAMRALTL